MCEPSSSPCTNPAGSKINALKTATHSLLTMFQNASATAGDVQVSLIPFNRDVNVGASNAGATWLDWSEWDETHGACSLGTGNSYNTKTKCTTSGSCSISGNTSQSACEAATVTNCSTNNYANQYTSKSQCDNAHTCTISPASNTTQNACETATSGVCDIGNYASQYTCTSNYIWTCSIAGYNSQGACEAAYVNTCSIAGYASKSACEAAYTGTCSLTGYATEPLCTAAYVGSCSISGKGNQNSCESAYACTNPAYLNQQNNCTTKNECSNGAYAGNKTSCQNAGFIWGKGTWKQGVWTKTYGVWNKTYGVWGKKYGAWGKTYGKWTTVNGVWNSTPGVFTTTYGVWSSNNGVWTPDHTGWNGCIMDRGTIAGPPSSTTNSGYDLVNTTPGTAPESRFPTENYTSQGVDQCPVQMLGLGYDWAALNSKVDAMGGRGNTNQPIGLAWAWQSLTQGDPLNPPSLPSGTTRHIILLSDGENTQNRWYPSGSSSTRQKIDDRMHLQCNNAKNDNVTVWSVFVNIAGTAGNAASMQDCATGGALGGHYCEATTTQQINACFSSIGQQITNLRVAH
jgi:hypothetical protein